MTCAASSLRLPDLHGEGVRGDLPVATSDHKFVVAAGKGARSDDERYSIVRLRLRHLDRRTNAPGAVANLAHVEGMRWFAGRNRRHERHEFIASHLEDHVGSSARR